MTFEEKSKSWFPWVVHHFLNKSTFNRVLCFTAYCLRSLYDLKDSFKKAKLEIK